MGIRVALAVVVVVSALPGLVQAQATPVDRGWVSLGPGGPLRADEVAVSSDWPADPFLVARLKPPGAPSSGPPKPPSPNDPPPGARSSDGGRTWQPLPALPSGTLRVVQTVHYGRVLLAFDRRTSSSSGGSEVTVVKRSTDDGESWETTAMVPRNSGAWNVAVSPAVREDGRILLLSGGRLFDSRDAGATWQPIDPMPGQLVSALAFSSEFARDLGRRRLAVLVAAAQGRHVPDGRAA